MSTECVIKCSFDKMVNIKTLKPNPLNPNEHTDEQIVLFAAILKYQGVRRPVRVSKRCRLMTVGHGMIKAFKLNGWNKVPVDYQHYDNEGQEYADMVADNELNRMSKTSYSMVNKDLPKFGPDITPTMLAMPSFKIEPADKSNGSQFDSEGVGQIKESLVYSLKPSNAKLVRSAIEKSRKLLDKGDGKPPTNGQCLLLICESFMSKHKSSKTRRVDK